MLKRLYLVMAASLIFGFSACSQSDLGVFQDNKPTPDFTIFTIVNGYEGLQELWDSIDAEDVNAGLADSIKNNTDEFVNFSQIMADIFNTDAGGGRNPLQNLLGEASGLLDWTTSTDPAFYYNDIIDSLYSDSGTAESYQSAFYSFLEKASGSGDDSDSGDILGIARIFMQYIVDTKDNGEIRDFMESLVDMTQDADFKEDFTDLSKTLSTLLIRADYPMWVDGSGNLITDPANIDAGDINLELGNAVKGTQALILALSRVMMHDDVSKEVLFDIIREGSSLVTAENSQKLKQLISNLEDYYTVGGAGITTDYINTGNPYVNTDLGTTLREMWPALQKLFIKTKPSWDTTERPDLGIYDDAYGKSPVEFLARQLNNLKTNCNIDFANYDGIEDSLKQMVELNGYGEERSGASYKVSFLDHLLYTLTGAYNFGYLTRMDDSGEPATNHSRGHGTSTGGIITVNDSMYSLTNGLVCGMGAYDLALDVRKDQADLIGRSRYVQFNGGGISSHKFYMGYDFPTLHLMPSACAGDAGLPNGGETGVVPADNTTSGNDYKTFFPKVGNGIGELNTGRFLMGWIARACWEGEGPYYYAPDKVSQSVETISYDVDGDSTAENCNVYRKANGDVYAYVYKPDSNPSNWTYYYPVSSSNDAADSDAAARGQRDNRYRELWYSDYYLIEKGATSKNVYCAPPMNDNGTAYVEGTTGDDKYKLKDSGSFSSQRFMFKEKIAEDDSIRECGSQEEAMYRNFQWLLLEKKFVFIIPMSVNGLNLLFSAAYVVIEANGAAGLATAKKGTSYGRWVLKGDEGVDLDDFRSPKYGDSHELGDGRIVIFVREASVLGLVSMDLNAVWNTVLGNGKVLPDAVGANIGPITRMAFLQPDLVPSDADASLPAIQTAWENRNRLLPVIIALAGSLHSRTVYEAAASGNNYNYAGDHKYPLKDLLGGLVPALAKPYYRHFTDSGGRWVPRMNNENSQGNFAYFEPSTNTNMDYRPRASLRPLTSFLTENTTAACDGIIPALAETDLVTKLLVLLQNMGANEEGSIYRDVDPASEDLDQWGARRQLFYGLEQIFTDVKTTRGGVVQKEYENAGSGFWTDQRYDNDKWKWMFVTGQNADGAGEYQDFAGKRDVDLVLDNAIYGMVGHNYISTTYPGKGLASYPDTNQWKVKEPLSVFTTLVTDTLAEKPDAGADLVQIWLDNTQIGSADASGNITGSGINGTGTVNYTTKAVNFTLAADPGTAKVTCTYRFGRVLATNHNWEGFDELVETMEEFVDADGQYAILERLISVMENALSGGSEDITAEEAAGLTYTLGKLLAYYDDDADTWVYQGEDGFNNLYNILAVHLPAMHSIVRDETGSNYAGMLVLMADMMKEDGMLEAVLDSAHTQAGWEQLLNETRDLLAEIDDPDSRFNAGSETLWDVLGSLLQDMAGAIKDYNDGGEDALRQLYRDYGFQYNG